MDSPQLKDLIRPTTAANLLGMDFSLLGHYRRKGRFCKEYRIDGQPFFIRDEVIKWNSRKLHD